MKKEIRIAVLDDENEILDIFEHYFTHEGCDITLYRDPFALLSDLSEKEERLDLLLLDIMMPRMNGVEVLKKIREMDTKIKIIMMTAYSTLDKILDSKSYGADDYIVKPFESLQSVHYKVDEVLLRD